MDSIHLFEPKMEPTFDHNKLHSVDIKEEYSHYTIKPENMNFGKDQNMMEMESKIHYPDGNLQSTLKLDTEENVIEYEEDMFKVKVEDLNEDDTEYFPEYIKNEELILKDEEKEVDFCAITNAHDVPMGVPSRAAKTVPKGILELRPSAINGFGIYTLRQFQKGVQFGPYEGKLTKLASTEGYVWKLIGGRLLDESGDTESNYLQYINCARDISEQNLEAFQRKGEIYFCTCRDVTDDEELLIYFDNTSDNTYYKPREENADEEIYGCQFCQFGFRIEADRENHQQFCRFSTARKEIDNEKTCRCTETGETNHQNKPAVRNHFQCEDSNCTMNRKSSLKAHKQTYDKSEKKNSRKSKHDEKKVFKCTDCNYKTFVNSSFNRHKKSMHEKKVIKCTDCNYETFHTSSLSYHRKVKHEPKHFLKCADCNFETFMKFSLIRHRKYIHERKNVIKCTDCNYETFDISSLARHKTVKHEQKHFYKCADCDFGTFDKSYLKVHRNVKHEHKRLFKCSDCNFETFMKCSFVRHKKVKHERKELFKCADCDFKTYYSTYLKTHRKIKHEQKKRFQCADCDYKTDKKFDMNNHTNSKHEQIKLKCVDCEFETFYKPHMNRHKNVKHERKHLFKCADCNYETFDVTCLNRHRKTKHESKDAFKCTDCNYETYDISNFYRHRKSIHDRKNVFKCADCNYETFHSFSLSRHRKVTHEQKKIVQFVILIFDQFHLNPDILSECYSICVKFVVHLFLDAC